MKTGACENLVLSLSFLGSLSLLPCATYAATEEEIEEPPVGSTPVQVLVEPMPDSAHMGSGGAPINPNAIEVPPPGSPDSIYKAFTWQDNLGNSTWGASYGILGEVRGTSGEASESGNDELCARGRLFADATLFGRVRNVAEVVGTASGDSVGHYVATFDVRSLGATILHKDVTVDTTETKIFARSFFGMSTTYPIGIFVATVSGSVGGGLGYQVGTGPIVGAGGGGFRFAFTPKAEAFVNASATVGVVVARIGITGSLTLLHVGLPIVAEESFDPTYQFAYFNLSSSLSIKTLAGNLLLFVEALGTRWEKTIAKWNGLQKSYTLFSRTGGLAL